MLRTLQDCPLCHKYQIVPETTNSKVNKRERTMLRGGDGIPAETIVLTEEHLRQEEEYSTEQDHLVSVGTPCFLSSKIVDFLEVSCLCTQKVSSCNRQKEKPRYLSDVFASRQVHVQWCNGEIAKYQASEVPIAST